MARASIAMAKSLDLTCVADDYDLILYLQAYPCHHGSRLFIQSTFTIHSFTT